MEITEVRVRLIPNRGSGDRLRAFCSVTLDGDFVIRDLKVIDGANGIFVAMPSRKLADRCPRCHAKNHLRARFCNECGAKLNRERVRKDQEGRPKYHADVAHPINSQCRERIEKAVKAAYEQELERAKSPDYKPVAVDDDEFADSDYDDLIADLKREAAKRRGSRSEAQSDVPVEAREQADEMEELPFPSEPEPEVRREERREERREDRRGNGRNGQDRDRDRSSERPAEPRPPRAREPISERPAAPPPPPPTSPPRESEAPEPDSDFGSGIL